MNVVEDVKDNSGKKKLPQVKNNEGEMERRPIGREDCGGKIIKIGHDWESIQENTKKKESIESVNWFLLRSDDECSLT